MFRVFISVLLLSISLGSCAQRKKMTAGAEITVYGTLTQTSMWCGGARPPEELVKELATPKPLDTYDLYIRKDTNNLSNPILYKVKTDKNGNFTLKLKAGKYVVVDSKKKDKATYKATLEKYKTETETTGKIDKDCYAQFVATPDFEIVVPKSAKGSIKVSHNYHRTCDWVGTPCVEYKGALPQ